MYNEPAFKQEKGKNMHVNHVRIWTAFIAFMYGDKFNNGFPTLLRLNSAP